MAWLNERQPDVVCLQETKCIDEAFPREPLESLGYNVAIHGQKGFNGVAILSKFPFDEVTPRLPGDDSDEQARFMEARSRSAGGWCAWPQSICPMEIPSTREKYPYKIRWMDRLSDYASERLKLEEPLILAGDYNVIPAPPMFTTRPPGSRTPCSCPQTREKFRSITNLGLTDALRATSDAPGLYTFWDYQAGAWQKNNGLRIDHILLSPQAADRLVTAGIDRHVRDWEKPSDHVPVYADLAIG